MKSMKRAERRHLTRMARLRAYRLVEGVCGVNLREYPTKSAERGGAWNPVVRHKMRLISDLRYKEVFEGTRQEVLARRQGALINDRDRRTSGKSNPCQFDLVESRFKERVSYLLNRRRDQAGVCACKDGKFDWQFEDCEACWEYDSDRYALWVEFSHVNWSDEASVDRFRARFDVFVDRYVA